MKKILLVLFGLLGVAVSVNETFNTQETDFEHGTFGYRSKVYAGVKAEERALSHCFAGSGWEFITCPFALLAIGAIPGSFIADTLLLPRTLSRRQQNDEQHQKCLENKRKQGRDDDLWCTKKY